MTKIVCDTDTVIRISENIKKTAENMLNTSTNYQSTVISDLTSWQGKTQSNFFTGVSNQVININNNISSALAIAEHIKKSAELIETTEEELSSLSI